MAGSLVNTGQAPVRLQTPQFSNDIRFLFLQWPCQPIPDGSPEWKTVCLWGVSAMRLNWQAAALYKIVYRVHDMVNPSTEVSGANRPDCGPSSADNVCGRCDRARGVRPHSGP